MEIGKRINDVIRATSTFGLFNIYTGLREAFYTAYDVDIPRNGF